MEEYTNAVIKEIGAYDKICADTLYIGGGTPTFLPNHLLEKILDAAFNHFSFDAKSEVTVEANPKTVDLKKLKSLLGSGVNRISLGVQSLCDDELKALGRAHSGQDAIEAIENIKTAGFENFSLDVISALPNQTTEKLYKTVKKLLEYKPPHFSAYSLSIDEGTPFFINPPKGLPSEDEEREIYWFLVDTLKSAGYDHYEISNFALENYKARHNTKYWLGEEYIGIGAGAHSYFEGKRYENSADVLEYIKNPHQRHNTEIITQDEKKKEYYMLGLRLLKGVPEIYHENMDLLIGQGLVLRKNGNVLLTRRGIDIANYVMEQLL